MQRLIEWQRLHFFYQPRDALNSGSSLNSFAFRRSINPLTATPMRNEARTLLNDQKDKNLMMWWTCLDACENWPMRIFHTQYVVTWYYDSFESHTFNSWLIYFVIVFLLFDRKRTLTTLASLLCKPFQYSLIELQILRREASHRIPFRWQFNLAVKKVRLIFPPATDHGPTDAIFSGDFRVIFNSFCFGNYFKFKGEVVWRATSLGHDDNLTWNKRLRTRDCLVDTYRFRFVDWWCCLPQQHS